MFHSLICGLVNVQSSVQTQEAAGASQQKERMFGIEEQHFHIVQGMAAGQKALLSL